MIGGVKLGGGDVTRWPHQEERLQHRSMIREGRSICTVQSYLGSSGERRNRGEGAVGGHHQVIRQGKAVAATGSATRAPLRFSEIYLAQVEPEDFRRNARGELGTRTATLHKDGIQKLRQGWIYLDPPPIIL